MYVWVYTLYVCLYQMSCNNQVHISMLSVFPIVKYPLIANNQFSKMDNFN